MGFKILAELTNLLPSGSGTSCILIKGILLKLLKKSRVRILT